MIFTNSMYGIRTACSTPEINYLQVGPGDYVKAPEFYDGIFKRTLEKCKKYLKQFIVEPTSVEGAIDWRNVDELIHNV